MANVLNNNELPVGIESDSVELGCATELLRVLGNRIIGQLLNSLHGALDDGSWQITEGLNLISKEADPA